MPQRKNNLEFEKDKMKRFILLDQLLRNSDGYTFKELYNRIDDISERQLRSNLRELEEKFGARFDLKSYRGNKRLWKYADSSFSIVGQTNSDFETIQKAIEKLAIFEDTPQFLMLKLYLLDLKNILSDSSISFMSFDHNADLQGLEFLEDFAKAIIHKYPLKVYYHPFDIPAYESYIHPYHLRQFNNRWYIFAYSEDKERIVNYALDRVESIEFLSKPYIASDINFEEYCEEIVGVTNYDDACVEKIVLRVSKKSASYIRTKPLHNTQKEIHKLETEEDIFIQLEVKINTELKMLLSSYNDAIEVISPKHFRESMAISAEKMYNNYFNSQSE